MVQKHVYHIRVMVVHQKYFGNLSKLIGKSSLDFRFV